MFKPAGWRNGDDIAVCGRLAGMVLPADGVQAECELCKETVSCWMVTLEHQGPRSHIVCKECFLKLYEDNDMHYEGKITRDHWPFRHGGK